MELSEKTVLKDAENPNAEFVGDKTGEDKKEEPPPITKKEILIMVSFALNGFITGIYFDMLGPFFPNEAHKKGASSLMVGLIFGIYSIMIIVASPFIGFNIGKIGSKFTLISGIVTCGLCSLSLGFTYLLPSGPTFIGVCIALRIIEGIGSAAFQTGAFAIIGVIFPDRVSTIFGTLQACTTLGSMLGPPIGGLLFEAGGFKLPFILTGSLMVLTTIPSIILIPSSKGGEAKMNFRNSLRLFTSPLVNISCAVLISISSLLGFVSVALSPILINTFHFKTSLVGAFFLAATVPSAIFAPIVGFLADKKPKTVVWLLTVGMIFTAMSYFLLGEAPTNPIPHNGVIMIGFGLLAEGLAMSLIGSSFRIFTDAASDRNFPDNFETFGLISSILISTMALGQFIGPFIGGAFIDSLGFVKAANIGGFVSVGLVALVSVAAIWTEVRRCKMEKVYLETS